VSLIRNLELASDVVSLASGRVPISPAFRLIPMFFRRKGLTKAQMKKMMMRRRRMFVDTVIVQHKRIHDKNREQIIEQTKARLAGRPKSQIKLRSKTTATPLLNRAPNKNRSDNRSKVKPQEPHKNRIKGLIDNERQKSRSKWAVKVRSDGSSREM
jgi:hypothetical protein